MGLRETHMLVTGAGGFIGSAVTRALVQRDVSVSALLGPPGAAVVPPPEGSAHALAEIDDLPELVRLASDAEVIIHIAGPPSVAASFSNPAEYARVHVVGTATVLEACRQVDARRLVYISSAEVYGQPKINPVTENFLTSPRSPYGAAKLGGEAYVETCARAFGFEAVILRPFSVYGPGGSERSVLGTIWRQALHGCEIKIQDPRPVRDYCFIDDLVEAIWLSCIRPQSDQVRTYNIGTGVGTSVGQLIEHILEILHLDLPIQVASQTDRPAGTDILELISDSTRALDELGWRAETSLKKGLKRTIEFLEANSNLS